MSEIEELTKLANKSWEYYLVVNYWGNPEQKAKLNFDMIKIVYVDAYVKGAMQESFKTIPF